MSTRPCPKCDNIVKFSFFQFSFTKLTCENCKTKLRVKQKRTIFEIVVITISILCFIDIFTTKFLLAFFELENFSKIDEYVFITICFIVYGIMIFRAKKNVRLEIIE